MWRERVVFSETLRYKGETFSEVTLVLMGIHSLSPFTVLKTSLGEIIVLACVYCLPYFNGDHNFGTLRTQYNNYCCLLFTEPSPLWRSMRWPWRRSLLQSMFSMRELYFISWLENVPTLSAKEKHHVYSASKMYHWDAKSEWCSVLYLVM